jgi:curli biogenesis system outer membrane secretion channel CsgG
MKKLITLALVLVSFMSLAQDATMGLKRVVAVVPLENRTDGSSELSQAITDILITELVKSGSFQVIERDQLNLVLKEQNLAEAGLTSPGTAPILRKLLGVQLLITGTITEYGSKDEEKSTNIAGFGSNKYKQIARVVIDLRVINTTTGEIMIAERAAGEEEVSSGGASVFGHGKSGGTNYDATLIDKAKAKSIQNCVKMITDNMGKAPWEGKVIKINTDGTIIMKPGTAGGVKNNMKFTIYSKGEEVIDPDTGLSLGADLKKIGTCTVISDFGADGKACKAKIDAGGTGMKAGDVIKID